MTIVSIVITVTDFLETIQIVSTVTSATNLLVTTVSIVTTVTDLLAATVSIVLHVLHTVLQLVQVEVTQAAEIASIAKLLVGLYKFGREMEVIKDCGTGRYRINSIRVGIWNAKGSN